MKLTVLASQIHIVWCKNRILDIRLMIMREIKTCSRVRKDILKRDMCFCERTDRFDRYAIGTQYKD